MLLLKKSTELVTSFGFSRWWIVWACLLRLYQTYKFVVACQRCIHIDLCGLWEGISGHFFSSCCGILSVVFCLSLMFLQCIVVGRHVKGTCKWCFVKILTSLWVGLWPTVSLCYLSNLAVISKLDWMYILSKTSLKISCSQKNYRITNLLFKTS